MNRDLAEHISLIAATIYAALLAEVVSLDGLHAPAELLDALRRQAIDEALILWSATLDR